MKTKPKPQGKTLSGSAAVSKPERVWRRYQITHVIVRWQEQIGWRWETHTEKIPHAVFVKHFSKEPPAPKKR